ncbi:MAG: hypothetical protein ACOH13_14275 [Flavobacteriales bacterium]
MGSDHSGGVTAKANVLRLKGCFVDEAEVPLRNHGTLIPVEKTLYAIHQFTLPLSALAMSHTGT